MSHTTRHKSNYNNSKFKKESKEQKITHKSFYIQVQQRMIYIYIKRKNPDILPP